MFVRVRRVRTNGRDSQGLQVVEARDRDRITQHVLANFGRPDQVRASSELDRVLQGLAAHSPTLAFFDTTSVSFEGRGRVRRGGPSGSLARTGPGCTVGGRAKAPVDGRGAGAPRGRWPWQS